jgi:hypothetical protein
MANRYALVPDSWLQQHHQESKSGVVKPEAPQVPVQSEPPHVSLHAKVSQSNFSDLPSLLPKNMRSKARVLVHYLENGGVVINDMQRIVYDDGSVGSHILDLIRYAVSRFSKSRPLDWPKFQELLGKLGAPTSAIVQRFSPSPLSNWKTY